MQQTAPMPLVGLIEIGMRAGMQRPSVSNLRRRHDTFPRPVADLAIGPIFWWPDIKDWLISTGRPWDAGWTYEQVVGPKRTVARPFPQA